MRSEIRLTSWHLMLPQITGLCVPATLTLSIPLTLRVLWFEPPAWKVIAKILIALSAFIVLRLIS